MHSLLLHIIIVHQSMPSCTWHVLIWCRVCVPPRRCQSQLPPSQWHVLAVAVQVWYRTLHHHRSSHVRCRSRELLRPSSHIVVRAFNTTSLESGSLIDRRHFACSNVASCQPRTRCCRFWLACTLTTLPGLLFLTGRVRLWNHPVMIIRHHRLVSWSTATHGMATSSTVQQ